LTCREFESELLVLLNEEFATRRYIDRYCGQHGVTPRIAMEVNSIGAVIEIVQRSTLATVLPAAVAREHSELCLVDLEPALPQRTAALLVRKGAYRSAAARAFITLALEESETMPGGRRAKATE
jgi:LysR family cyn operon transcriptional activator